MTTSASPQSVVFSHLPQDDEGWTIFKPSAESRIMYVSSSTGDDRAGQVYTAGDADIGTDPTSPSGTINAFKTVAAAIKNARNEQPDWVLLARGEAWPTGLGQLPSGRSKLEPFVAGAWGPSTERPMLNPTGETSWAVDLEGFHDIVITGLDFYACARDPNSSSYVQGAGNSGVHVEMTGAGEGLLVEDCRFRFIGFAIMADVDAGGSLRGVSFRRSLILDNYGETHHAQGMFAASASLLLEENIFDHNGWLVRQKDGDNTKAGGQATMYNHNTYFSSCYDCVFRGNMFLRGSSGGNKWTANKGPGSSYNLTMDNNLYVEGEVGIGVGGNKLGPLRFKGVTIQDNVLMHLGRDRPTNRDLGWYMHITDWDGGVIKRNLLLHQQSDQLLDVYGIFVGIHDFTGQDQDGSGVNHRDVLIQDNILYGLKTPRSGLSISNCSRLENISFIGNQIQFPGLDTMVLSTELPISGVFFSGNSYFSGKNPEGWFHLGAEGVCGGNPGSGGTPSDLKAWKAASGEENAVVTETTFSDPDRSVESYQASLGGAATLEDFIARARLQSKANWRREYTAAAVNDYIREGFKHTPA